VYKEIKKRIKRKFGYVHVNTSVISESFQCIIKKEEEGEETISERIKTAESEINVEGGINGD